MNELIEQVAARVGIPAEQASKAVDTVMDFLRENPEKITELLGNEAVQKATESLGLGDVSGKLGKLFGR